MLQREFQKGFYKLKGEVETIEIVDRVGNQVGIYTPAILVTKLGNQGLMASGRDCEMVTKVAKLGNQVGNQEIVEEETGEIL